MHKKTSFADLMDGGYAALGHCHAFGWTSATWAAIEAGAAVASVGVGVYSAVNAQSNARKSNDAMKANALENQKQSDEANNRANSRSPDSAAAMAANMLAGKAGQSGTMLTGPQGVDPTQLLLGKNALLGG